MEDEREVLVWTAVAEKLLINDSINDVYKQILASGNVKKEHTKGLYDTIISSSLPQMSLFKDDETHKRKQEKSKNDFEKQQQIVKVDPVQGFSSKEEWKKQMVIMKIQYAGELNRGRL